MAGSELARRIREMAEYFDPEAIARATSIPLEVVKGILSGELSDDVLEGYDPGKPPEIRVVEKHRYVRSRSIGVVSPGGCGATSVAAALAVAAAKMFGATVVAADFNEWGQLGRALGMAMPEDDAALYPNVAWLRDGTDAEEHVVPAPDIENLLVLLGMPSLPAYRGLTGEKMEAAVRSLGRLSPVVIVDCPSSVEIWPRFLPLLDFVVFVFRSDASSVAAARRVLMLFQKGELDGRSGAVFNFAGTDGSLTDAECRRAFRGPRELPVLGFLPEDPVVRRSFAAGECFMLKRNSGFASAASDLAGMLFGGPSTQDERGGVLAKLAAGILRGRR